MNEPEKLIHESYVGNETDEAIKKHVDDRERTNNLRDHFAGLAMRADLNASANAYYQKGTHIDVDSIAEFSYKLADAMLKAREIKSEN